MAISSSTLPYLALRTVMGREYHERLVKSVLEYRKAAPADVRARLESRLSSTLRVDGFKNPAKAPPPRLAKEITRHLLCCRGVLTALLDAWIESEPALRDLTSAYLRGPNVDLGGIFFVEENALAGWSPEMLGAISCLREADARSSADDVGLMICCLADESHVRFFEEEVRDHMPEEVNPLEETPDDNSPAPGEAEVAAGRAVVKSPILGRWLDELEKLPPEAEEWDEIEPFSQVAKHIASAKLEERTAASVELQRTLAEFVSTRGKALSFFDASDWNSWSSDGCPPGEEAAISAKLVELGAALDQHEGLQAQSVTSLAEARAGRVALSELEDEIVRALKSLNAVLLPIAPRPRGSQSELRDTLVKKAEEKASVSVDVKERALESDEGSKALGAPGADTSREIPADSATAQDAEGVETGRGWRTEAPMDGEGPTESDKLTSPAKLDRAGTQPDGTEPAPHGVAASTEPRGVAAPLRAVEEVDAQTSGTASLQTGEETEPINAASKEAATEPPVIDAKRTQPDGLAPHGPTPEVVAPEEAPGREQTSYLFTPEQTSSQIALLILSGEVSSRDAALRDLVWRLIFEERFGLASHLGRCLEANGGERLPRLPAWLPRAIILGRHVRHANGEIAHVLREDFALFGDQRFLGGDSEWDHGVRFFYAAAALRPALLAPNTNASDILERLRVGPGLVELYECCSVIAEYGKRRQALDPSALKGIGDATVWQAKMDALQRDVEEWSARAPQLQMGKFSRATQVWREWLKQGHLIHKLLLPVTRNEPSGLAQAKGSVERLFDDSEIRREIDYVDRQVLKRRVGEDIIAKAFVYLRNHMREALAFVSRWAELQESRPGQPRTYIQQQAEQLSQQVRGRQDAVRAELKEFERQHDAFFVRAGIQICRRALEDLWLLFDAETPVAFDEPPLPHLLHAELLKSPALSLDEQWKPRASVEEVLRAILELVASGEVSWLEAFATKSERRDHEATGRILEYLETYPETQAYVEDLRRRRERHIAECREALKGELDTTRKEVEGAVAFGLLREEERIALAAKVESVAALADETVRFDEARGRLREVRDEISHQREEEKESVRQRLESAGFGEGHPTYERIRAVLERGDVWTANEYIDLTLQNRPLPPGETKTNTFGRFFPQTARAVYEFMEPHTPADRPEIHKIVGDIRSYARGQRRTYAIGPIDMNGITGTQIERAAEMLESWFGAKKRRQIDRLEAKKILSNLGFSPQDIDVNQVSGRTWVMLTAELVKDRERCPLPAFGSNAGGRYRILCVWDRPTEEDLLGFIGDTAHGSPVLVFYFGRMTEQRRRDLARRCRQRRRTFVVIDDTLVLYLCGEPEPRLRAMFECSLPFTFTEPYTTTAGLVPVEMFYGRERERRSIMDPNGSCFIYGGRQLGKTALLRDVERRYNEQEKSVALWFDLKTHGIGLDKNVDDIWGLLAVELSRKGVVPLAASRQVTMDRFLEHIQRWLEEDDARRLLLLLDEADDFLVYDGKTGDGGRGNKGEFVRAARLKGLMDRTHRRFKVVFAGLHNVQRTTRLANHPLAHYGEPICIGPLLDGGEWQEARELVERPLGTLGYNFQTPDLVTRILWRTNYYPSLIQLYCNHLLKHLTDTRHAAGFDSKSSPPYVITSDHIDEVYRSNDLRKAIRDRLIWTLQLDQRYEVIAYAMALASFRNQERSMVEGFTVTWIRDSALYWWKDGFRESDAEDAVRALLDEMVGLGILRVVDASRYALRSSNVVFLMGTEEEIEAALLRSREVPLQYEPAAFRAAVRSGEGADDASSRSPLTAAQESALRARINGVSIIFGCRAAGLDDLEARLEAVFGGEFFINLEGTTNKATFERRLSELGERERQGTTLLLLPASCPWSAQWVNDALQRLKKLKSKSSFVHILFVADPATAWQLAGDDADEFRDLIAGGVIPMGLSTWHDSALRQWLDDCRLPSDPPVRERIAAVTGRWPLLLRRFYEGARANMQAWENSLMKLSESLGEPETACSLVEVWGLDNRDARRILRYLHAGEATAEELAEVMEDGSLETIRRRLDWARRLSLVASLGDGRWRVDDVVGRVISTAGE